MESLFYKHRLKEIKSSSHDTFQVRLREKVANRAVKVLLKSAKKAPGRERATLAMLLITFKHQRETVDKEAVLRGLVKLERALLEAIGGDGNDSQR